MDIKDIRAKTKAGAIQKEKERRTRQRKEEADQLKRDRKAKKEFNQRVKWRWEAICKQIEEAANNGYYSTNEDVVDDKELAQALVVILNEAGFTVATSIHYVEADPGDKDSG